jgi:hypothetical protein
MARIQHPLNSPDNPQMLDLLEAAQRDGDARTYAVLCRALAITQPPAGNLLTKGLELLAQDEAMEAEAAEHTAAEQAREARDNKLIRTAPANWGIHRADIETLAQDRRYGYAAAQDMYWAVHNLSLPPEMAARMTHIEILAKYWGTALVKKHGAQRKEDVPRDFYSAIRALDQAAYSNWQFLPLKRGATERYATTSGEQRKRLEDLGRLEKKQFVDSLFAPSHTNFHDPNVDGHDKSLYVRDAWKMLKERYQRAADCAHITKPVTTSSSS